MRCGASFCYRGNAEGVFEVTLTSIKKEAKHETEQKQNHNDAGTGTGAELEKAYVVFGNTGKDKQPIEWEILDYDEENERVMLISRYVVDKRNYNSSSEKNSWSASKLRKYLNGEFINESPLIRDIILPSISPLAENLKYIFFVVLSP